MRCAVWIVLLGMVIGCDAATESPQLIVLDAAAGVDGGVDSGALGVGGAGGEGGMGAGGEGGEGGMGAGGEGGEGGMGAGGEGGEGGMGAGGEGGIGGEGGMGAGGEGGEGGGACVPRCADRSCGADGCGGECGPACGDGAVCSDGACVRGECPAGTFECGGACVDLLTDKNHCGSCGHACVEEWPQEWTDRGFTPQDANIGPSCVDAECSFVCPDAETDVQHLFDDPQNCGACGNVCDTGAVNSQQDACRDAQCRCVVTHDEERVLGNTCDGYCQLAGYVNCDGGCCPTLEPGANRLAVADDLHHFVFDMAEPGGVRIAAECTRAYGWLVAYEDDGQVPEIVYWNCGERKLAPLLPAGRYGVIARSWDLPGDIVFERVALPVDFVAPGAQVRTASLRSATVTFRVPVADDYSVALRSAGGGCLGGGVVTLYDGDARVVDVMAERDCIRHLDARWEGRLSAGVYRVVATASASFNGDWRVAVERSGGAPEPEPEPEPGGINGAGTYDFEGFGVDGSATLELTFADAATYTLTTAGPGGQGCPGDTILAVRPRGGDIIALNDDAIGVCSRLSFDAAAGVTYEAVITGYDGGAVGDGVLVVGR